jgi:WD40 repeat protein
VPPRFWVFISYSHADERHAQWLHRWLESYRLPKKLVGTTSDQQGFVRPASLRPVYRDREEFSAGRSLGDHITSALESSRNLVVICSPNAARSRWVNDEIRHFQSIGRGDRIFCLIVDGDPSAVDGPSQSLPAALRSPAASPVETLAADARPGRDKPRIAALRLVAGIVDTRFDELRQREQEKRVRQLSIVTAFTLALLAVVGWLAVDALQQRDVAKQQRSVAQLETRNAEQQKRVAEDRRIAAEAATVKAETAEKEAKKQQALADAATDQARQRQAEAESARRETLVQFKDATLRRLALESKAMFDGTRAGGALMAVRIALAGLAMEPRADQFGNLQAAVAAGDGSLRAWDVPGQSISAVAYSPDGKLIVAATRARYSNYRLRFWNASTGEPVGADIPNGEYVNGLVFSGDGQQVITASSEGFIRRWNVATRQSQLTPERLDGASLFFIAVSPTGDRWVTGGMGTHGLVLWGAEGDRFSPLALPGHTATVRSAAFSADGQRIVSGSEDQTIRVWDAQTGQPIGEPIVGHSNWVNSVAFSPDGKMIASASLDETVRLWRLESGRPAEMRIDHAGSGFLNVLFSPDGERVAAAGKDGHVRVWDARTGKPLGAELAGHRGAVRDMAFAPDGERIVSIGDDGTVRLWDGHGAARLPLVLDGQFIGIAFANGHGDHRLASTDFGGAVRQWNADTGRPVGSHIQVPLGSLLAAVYSADGRRLITASIDGVVRVWDAETGRAAMPPLRGHAKRVNTVAASADGKLLASGDESGQVIVWDAATGQAVRRLGPLRDNKVWSVGFSPDGQRLAASGAKGLFALWNLVSGSLIYLAPENPNQALTDLAFSPDGRYVATADRAQYTFELWDGRSGKPVERHFAGHSDGVGAVAFSPDGRFVASGGWDENVRLWDVESAEPIGAPIPIGGLVSGIAFSADGRRLAAASSFHNQIHVVDGPAAWAGLLCERLTRNLSKSEWQQYVGKEWPYLKQCPLLPIPAELTAASR